MIGLYCISKIIMNIKLVEIKKIINKNKNKKKCRKRRYQ